MSLLPVMPALLLRTGGWYGPGLQAATMQEERVPAVPEPADSYDTPQFSLVLTDLPPPALRHDRDRDQDSLALAKHNPNQVITRSQLARIDAEPVKVSGVATGERVGRRLLIL